VVVETALKGDEAPTCAIGRVDELERRLIEELVRAERHAVECVAELTYVAAGHELGGTWAGSAPPRFRRASVGRTPAVLVCRQGLIDLMRGVSPAGGGLEGLASRLEALADFAGVVASSLDGDRPHAGRDDASSRRQRGG
jgi:hypothetical protein